MVWKKLGPVFLAVEFIYESLGTNEEIFNKNSLLSAVFLVQCRLLNILQKLLEKILKKLLGKQKPDQHQLSAWEKLANSSKIYQIFLCENIITFQIASAKNITSVLFIF